MAQESLKARETFLVSFLFHKLGPPRYSGDVYSLPPEWLRRLIGLAIEQSCAFVRWDHLPSNRLDSHKNVVALTFDDGFESDVTQVLPLLQERSIPATFFIVPTFVGQPGYLRWDQVRALAEADMAVGSHTLTHAWLPELSSKGLQKELAVSQQIIEDHISTPVSLLSLPGGFYNQRVLEAAWKAGYTIVGTSDYGIDRLEGTGCQRRRVCKRNSVDLRISWKVIEDLLQGRVPRSIIVKSRAKRLLAGVLGPSRYRRVSDLWRRR